MMSVTKRHSLPLSFGCGSDKFHPRATLRELEEMLGIAKLGIALLQRKMKSAFHGGKLIISYVLQMSHSAFCLRLNRHHLTMSAGRRGVGHMLVVLALVREGLGLRVPSLGDFRSRDL